jgi:hypothetical protein
VSVLLRQPHGFEGLSAVCVGPKRKDPDMNAHTRR